MRNGMKVGISVICVISLLFVMISQTVDAATIVEGGVSSGNWIVSGTTGTYSEETLDLTGTVVPSWIQLLTKGVHLSAPAKICHSFRGSSFGWTGTIYQLVGQKWKKITTTTELSSLEGETLACATAASAGTYALFGYYTKSAGTVVNISDPFKDFSCEYVDTLGIGYTRNDVTHTITEIYSYGSAIFPDKTGGKGIYLDFPVGTVMQYEILTSGFSGDLTGTATIGDDGFAHFTGKIAIGEAGIRDITFRVTALGCSDTPGGWLGW